MNFYVIISTLIDCSSVLVSGLAQFGYSVKLVSKPVTGKSSTLTTIRLEKHDCDLVILISNLKEILEKYSYFSIVLINVEKQEVRWESESLKEFDLEKVV
jgi:hypothetical protein